MLDLNPQKSICFATEADLSKKGAGGITTDQQLLSCLRELGLVDVIHLQRGRHSSTLLALVPFCLEILGSFSRPFDVYFSRGLVTSFLLSLFRCVFGSEHKKIVHRSLSVPLASSEVRFLKYGRLESAIRYHFFRVLERFIFSRVDFVTVAAETYADELRNANVERAKIHIVNFHAHEDFFKIPAKSKMKKTFNFCYIGGFHMYQDLAPMIDAFDRFSRRKTNVNLLLVGDGPMRISLEREVENRNLRDHVKFAGKVPHSSLPAILLKVDCFISLTRKPGLSISILEAAAAQKIVIALAKDGDPTLNHFFRHAKEMFYVESVEPEAIAKAMEVVYANERLRKIVAEGARKIALQHFSRDVTIRQLQNLFQTLEKSQDESLS